jgi:hypothetical protein
MKLLFETIDLKKKPRRIDLVIPEGCTWQPPRDFFLGDRNIFMQMGTQNPTYVQVKVKIITAKS